MKLRHKVKSIARRVKGCEEELSRRPRSLDSLTPEEEEAIRAMMCVPGKPASEVVEPPDEKAAARVAPPAEVMQRDKETPVSEADAPRPGVPSAAPLVTGRD